MTDTPTPGEIVKWLLADTASLGCDCSWTNAADRPKSLRQMAAAEIERLQAEVNLARSGDIPHLLGMLEAFDRPAPKFIQTNQDRWREALSDDR